MSDVTITSFTFKIDIEPQLYFPEQFKRLLEILKRHLALELQTSVFLHSVRAARGQVYNRNQMRIRYLRELIQEVENAAEKAA